MRARLQTLNSSLTLGFGDRTNGVNITLPYASPDLNASTPIYSEPTTYFPLRASENDSMAVVGRAVLQGTYTNSVLFNTKEKPDASTDI